MKTLKHNVSNLSKIEIDKLHDKLLFTLKKDLKNKYNVLIRQKEFDLNSFEKTIIKEIKYFAFHNYPLYNQLFQLIERKFLKEIATYSEKEKNGLLTMNKIDNIIQPSSKYEYSMCVTYDIGKVTLRNVIEEEKNGIVVDKYPKRQKSPKQKTKIDLMKAYNSTLKYKK